MSTLSSNFVKEQKYNDKVSNTDQISQYLEENFPKYNEDNKLVIKKDVNLLCNLVVGDGTANGANSMSFGEGYAEGNKSVAFGTSHAYGGHSMAIQGNCSALGYASFVGGTNSRTGTKDISNVVPTMSTDTQDYAGYHHIQQSIGSFAWAIGKQNKAYGRASFAHGDMNETKGKMSHAEGHNTTAGSLSIQILDQSSYDLCGPIYFEGPVAGVTPNISVVTQGDWSHAEGSGTKTEGNNSHAEGIGCFTAKDATAAHAEGYYTQARAPYSHADGWRSYVEESDKAAYVWGGQTDDTTTNVTSNGEGTFSIYPKDDISGFYIGTSNLYDIIKTNTVKLSDVSDERILSVTFQDNKLKNNLSVDFSQIIGYEGVNDERILSVTVDSISLSDTISYSYNYVNRIDELSNRWPDRQSIVATYTWYQFTAEEDMFITGRKTGTGLAVLAVYDYVPSLTNYENKTIYRSDKETFPTENNPLYVKKGQTLAIIQNGRNTAFSLGVKYPRNVIKPNICYKPKKNYTLRFFDQAYLGSVAYGDKYFTIYHLNDDLSTYTSYDYVHLSNDSKNADNWRLACIRYQNASKSTICRFENNSEIAVAIELSGRSDFIGGYQHGDERCDSIYVYVDGKRLEDFETLSNEVECQSVRFSFTSRLYDPLSAISSYEIYQQLSNEVIAKHKCEYHFENNDILITQRVEWLSSEPIRNGYMPMLNVTNENDIVCGNGVYLDYRDLEIPQTTSYNRNHVGNKSTIYSTEKSFMAEMEILKQFNTTITRENYGKISEAVFDEGKLFVFTDVASEKINGVKIYNILQKGGDVVSGDVWSSKARLTYKCP